jgi:hypothetical protein
LAACGAGRSRPIWRGAGRGAGGVHFEIFETDFLHLPIRRVVDDIVDIVPKTISVLECRWVAVDKTRKGVEPATGYAAKVSEVFFEMTVGLGLHIETKRRPETGVDVIEVHASAIRRNVTGGTHGGLRRFTDRARHDQLRGGGHIEVSLYKSF